MAALRSTPSGKVVTSASISAEILVAGNVPQHDLPRCLLLEEVGRRLRKLDLAGTFAVDFRRVDAAQPYPGADVHSEPGRDPYLDRVAVDRTEHFGDERAGQPLGRHRRRREKTGRRAGKER